MIRIRLPGFTWRRLLAPDFGDRDPLNFWLYFIIMIIMMSRIIFNYFVFLKTFLRG